jgi:hypothetical protein
VPESVKIAATADLVRANEWSRRVYGALRDWEVARRGAWSTWSGGEIVLRIDRTSAGAPCEPITVAAAGESIAFHTRNWETALPLEGQTFEAAITSLRDLTRRWFSGELALAAFYLGDVWQGSLAIDPSRLEQEMQTALRWIAAQTAVDRVELHGPQKENDQRFGLAIDGKVLGVPPQS